MKIYYDGDCVFCRDYVQYLDLVDKVGKVELISLRSDHEDAKRILSLGLNVNTGFVIEHKQSFYHGADAFNYLNSLLKPVGIKNKLLMAVSKLGILSKLFYTILVFGRFILLMIQGGGLIDRQHKIDSSGDKVMPKIVRIMFMLLAIVYLVRIVLEKKFAFQNNFFEITSYVGFVTFSLIYIAIFFKDSLAKKIAFELEKLNYISLCYYLLFWLVTVNFFDLIVFRRVVGFLAILPLLRVFYRLAQEYSAKSDVGRLPARLPFAIIVFCFFPGLYLAPFYGGIAGWTLDIDKSKPVIVSGYKLVNIQGKSYSYNHAFFQPLTMDGRLRRAFISKSNSEELFMKFMFDNYKKIYPTLKKHKLPHQWLLGDFAYPTHNLSKSNSNLYVDNFSPENIREIIFVKEAYTWNNQLVNVEIIKSYKVNN